MVELTSWWARMMNPQTAPQTPTVASTTAATVPAAPAKPANDWSILDPMLGMGNKTPAGGYGDWSILDPTIPKARSSPGYGDFSILDPTLRQRPRIDASGRQIADQRW